MAIKRRPPPPADGIPGLDPAVEELLVGGPSDADPFLEFTLSVEEIRALVREHAATLHAAAVRRGLRAAWGALHYRERPTRPRRKGRA